MREIQLGSHTVVSHGYTVARTHKHDWLILMLLVLIEISLYIIHPFYRFVGKDMMTDLKYPLKSNTVPFWAVPVSLLYYILDITCKFVFKHYTNKAFLFSWVDVCSSIAYADISYSLYPEERCL